MNQAETSTIHIPPAISVNDFARLLNLSPSLVITELMKNGVLATINELIDYETAAIVGAELGFEIEPEKVESDRPSDNKDTSITNTVQPRPPVVAVMGHVDHGKTSLLDTIRESSVAEKEAGGITQHIGAYQVKKNDRLITFLDTPGHEAFAALRAHGARMTDIVIIVVAADDGVKPQTKEAIAHAKAAGAHLVVAINKIDKAGADVARVKQELVEAGVKPDDWGGDVPCVEVSAKQKTGIDKLLDILILVSDIVAPTATVDGNARGLVIESHMESGRGPVVTLLVQEGILHTNTYIIAASTYGKVRLLEDFHGKKIKSATPATPVVMLGLKSLPEFGDWFEVVANEKEAKEWVSRQAKKQTVKSLMTVKSSSVADVTAAVEEGKIKELPLLVKADVAGSLESLISSLEMLANDDVRVRLVANGVGPISENDINTAAASSASILGFNVSISAPINQLAKRSGVNFKLYRIIYELLDDVRAQLHELMPTDVIEHEQARLKTLAIFKTTKETIVTGGKVTSGKITPNLLVHVLRDKAVIAETKLLSLQKNKAVAKEVKEGEECGVVIANSIELEVGDELQFYKIEHKKRQF